MDKNMNATTTAVLFRTWPTQPSTTPESISDTFNEVFTIGIPLVVIFLILLALCMMLLYSKARRRRAAAHGRRDPMTSISGGVPMNANAYLNYAQRDLARQQIPAPVVGGTCPVHNPYIVDGPPSYEDAMKEVNTSYASGIVNASFSTSAENMSEPPPLYQTNTDPSSENGNGADTQNIDSNRRNHQSSHTNMIDCHQNPTSSLTVSQYDSPHPMNQVAISQSDSEAADNKHKISSTCAGAPVTDNHGDQEVPSCTSGSNGDQP